MDFREYYLNETDISFEFDEVKEVVNVETLHGASADQTKFVSHELDITHYYATRFAFSYKGAKISAQEMAASR